MSGKDKTLDSYERDRQLLLICHVKVMAKKKKKKKKLLSYNHSKGKIIYFIFDCTTKSTIRLLLFTILLFTFLNFRFRFSIFLL